MCVVLPHLLARGTRWRVPRCIPSGQNDAVQWPCPMACGVTPLHGSGRSRVIGRRIAAAPLARETSLSLCNPIEQGLEMSLSTCTKPWMNAARSISGQGRVPAPRHPHDQGAFAPLWIPASSAAKIFSPFVPNHAYMHSLYKSLYLSFLVKLSAGSKNTTWSANASQ